MATGLFQTGGLQTVEGPEGAGFWIRAAARILDGGIHFLVSFVAGAMAGIVVFVLASLAGVPPEALFDRAGTTTVATYVASFLGTSMVHVLSEGLHGSTIGKWLCRITVISEDGGPADLVAALKREMAFYVDSFFFGLVAIHSMKGSPRRQRIGDKWADTMVVKLADVPPSARRSGWRFVVVALAALVADGALLFTGVMVDLSRQGIQ